MACRDQLIAYLREHEVSFQTQQHPQAFSAQELAEREHISGKIVAKSVIVKADGQLIQLVLPATYRVDFTRISATLGFEEVHLVDEPALARAFPDCEVGALPPFGNLYHLPVYVDQSLTEDERIVFPAGTHTETISLRYADFDRLVKPSIFPFASQKAGMAR